MNFEGSAMLNFTPDLIHWNRNSNHRHMPWKGEKDPYRVWLSEVILQQTRVEQGWPYYERFNKTFPNIVALAEAPDEVVFKLWEGLGYYSRCRNLITTARHVRTEYKGIFPSNYEGILGLKGVGPYTAAAIASFAFDLPHAVVDGNVSRVLSRCFGISIPVDSTKGRAVISELANQLLDKNDPAEYNQSIMDHGATICKPAQPLCDQCPFNSYCIALQQGKVNELPVKEKKKRISERWFYYMVMEVDGNIIIQKRENKDIWQGLYEFLLIEKDNETDQIQVIDEMRKRFLVANIEMKIDSISPEIKQQLSHQKIRGRFFRIRLNKVPVGYELLLVPRGNLANYPFPGFINSYLRHHYQ